MQVEVSDTEDSSGGERVETSHNDVVTGVNDVNDTVLGEKHFNEGDNDIFVINHAGVEHLASDNDYTWSDVEGKSFTASLRAAYGEVVHWRRNIFLVPSGSVGKEFVRELTRLLESFTQHSAQEAISICAAMTLPQLLLQKTHAKSKSKENVDALKRRLLTWREGDLQALLREGRAIQSDFPNSKPCQGTDEAMISRSFANLVHHGRTRAALRLLDTESRGGVLSLDQECDGKTVREVLREASRG